MIYNPIYRFLAQLAALFLPLFLISQVSFNTSMVLPVGSACKKLAVGDLNDDGRKDVLIATQDVGAPGQDYKLNLFLSGQDGLETNPIIINYPNIFPGLSALSVGDIDNDGLNDIVIGIQDQIGIFRQNDDHTFGNAEMMYSGNSVDGISIGDVDNDGLNDLAVSHWNEPSIKIFHQTANGFITSSYPKPEGGRDQIHIGDMNGDGLNDVVVMIGQLQESGLHVFLQNQTGALQPYVTYQSPTPGIEGWMNGFAIGDLNGDGLNDLVATQGGNEPDARISIWYQDPISNNFQIGLLLQAYQAPVSVEIADLDCDGRNEIIVGHQGFGAISVFEQENGLFNGYNVFHFSADGPSDNSGLGVADINGDGRKDVLTANWQFGLTCSVNSTAPDLFDSLLTSVVVEVIGSGTVQDSWSYNLYEIDTIGDAVIGTLMSFSFVQTTQVDTIRTDTMLMRYGAICGHDFADTIHQITITVLDSVLGVDSLPPTVLHIDTLNVGIQEMDRVAFSITPNPASGSIEIQAPEQKLPARFLIIDSKGVVVRESEATSWPHRIELESLPSGRFSVVEMKSRDMRSAASRQLIITR